MSNWTDLIMLYGNEEGARRAFEGACEMIIRKQNWKANVHGIRVHRGDSGIDVYVGSYGSTPIDVYQCKYFVRGVGESQRQQIKQSYHRATTAKDFEVNAWYLCLPMALSTEETQWFQKWSEGCSTPVTLLAHTELMEWAETSDLAKIIFKREDSQKLDQIIQSLEQNSFDPWAATVEQAERDCYKVLIKLIRTHHDCVGDTYKHLNPLREKAEKGDRLYACEYIKSVLAGSVEDNHKVWIYNILSDFTLEPVAHRFIRRYDLLVEDAKISNKLGELSTSELYSTWALLRSPVLQGFRDRAHWHVNFN